MSLIIDRFSHVRVIDGRIIDQISENKSSVVIGIRARARHKLDSSKRERTLGFFELDGLRCRNNNLLVARRAVCDFRSGVQASRARGDFSRSIRHLLKNRKNPTCDLASQPYYFVTQGEGFRLGNIHKPTPLPRGL